MARRFTTVLGRLGLPTGDGRLISPGALTSRDLPLPLAWQRQSSDGHSGSVIVARLETVEFHQDMVTAAGTMLDVPERDEVEQLIEAGVIGPSMDLDDLTYVVDDQDRIIITSARVAGATLVSIPAFAEVSITLDPLPAEPLGEPEEPSDMGWLMASVHPYRRSEHSGAGNCACGMAEHSLVHPHPFAKALQGEGCVCSRSEADPLHGDALLASAATVEAPPLEWFARPDEVGPVTVRDGRVFGYVAPWDVCHIGLPGCTTAPSSHTSYAHFLRQEQTTATGETIPVGVLTVGGGHADPGMGAVPAMAHYDDVGAAVAKVNIGEDEHGIWVAGYVLPYADPVKVQQLSDLDVSGDWRVIGGNLELVAVCAVNTPGFPVLRKVSFSMERGGQQSLIATFKVQPPALRPVEDESGKARAAWARARWNEVA